MPWGRSADRTELMHLVVTGYQKRKYPRKYYVSLKAGNIFLHLHVHSS